MKKAAVIVGLVWLLAGKDSWGQARYDNPGQGIFKCHTMNETGREYIKGGGYLIFWGDLQTRNPDGLVNKLDSFDRTAVGRIVGDLRAGKKKYLQIQTFYAQNNYVNQQLVRKSIPDWIRQGPPAGTPWEQIADVRTGIFKERPDEINMLACGGESFPSPWDRDYLDRLKEFLGLLNRVLEENNLIDQIEYIEPSLGGRWLAPDLWCRDGLTDWAAQGEVGCYNIATDSVDCGCFQPKWTKAVNNILDIYQEAFSKIPMMFIHGTSNPQQCQYSGFTEAANKYGLKLYYKGAGLGIPRSAACGTMGNAMDGFIKWCARNKMVRCGYEPNAPSRTCGGSGNDGYTLGQRCDGSRNDCLCKYPEENTATFDTYQPLYEETIMNEGVSYNCLYGQDISCGAHERTNVWVANHIGAQVSLKNHNVAAGAKRIGEALNIRIGWRNEGSTALVAALKKGLFWEPSSYKMFLDLVKTDGTTYTQVLADDLKTNAWAPGVRSPFEVETNVNWTVPGFLGGESETAETRYRLYVGWVDPNGENKRFALTNSNGENDDRNRRYLLTDNFRVAGRRSGEVPTAVPTPTIGPSPTMGPSPTVRPTATAGPTRGVSPTGSVASTPTARPTGPAATETPGGEITCYDNEYWCRVFTGGMSGGGCKIKYQCTSGPAAANSCATLNWVYCLDQVSESEVPCYDNEYWCGVFTVGRSGGRCRIKYQCTSGPAAANSCATLNWVYCLDPLPTVVPGDGNRDGRVDLADFQIWKGAYLGGGGSGADFNGDGRTDLADFMVWKLKFAR